MNRRWVVVAAACAAAIAVGIYIWRQPSSPTHTVARASISPERARPAASPRATLPTSGASQATATQTQDELVTYLRSRYGKNIRDPRVQIEMLEELMRHFQKENPDNWEQALLAAVRAAFPELYDELAAMLERRVAYGDWMKQHRARLQGLDPQERQAAIWEERNRLFGQDVAERIWASEIKNRAVSDALAAIDTHEGASIPDKLSMYQQALEDIYQEHTDAYLQRHQHDALNRFIGLESVQAELSRMSAAERSQSLRQIRQGMGLDEQALARWDDLDRTRDERWEQGRAYMQEREALTAQYTDAELEAKLTELRARYFGTEAEVIAREEASGFFRFEQPRRWGQN